MTRPIILIEDEPGIADNVVYALKQAGYEPHWYHEGQAGLKAAADLQPLLVILDVGLPDTDGFEICRQLRKTSDVPVIFLTARSDEIDRVVGLEIGGDDYMVKPFSPRELIARIKVILRRVMTTTAEPDHTHETAGFRVDEAGKRIWFQGQLLALTAYEFGILALLSQQPGRIFSRAQLMDAVWSAPEESFERAVDTHIKTLRAKLRAIDPDHESLITHRGLGYSLNQLSVR